MARAGLGSGERAGRARVRGLGRGKRWAGLRFGPISWVELGFGFSILFLFLFFSFLNLIQTKFEFKYGFEFKPHSNKSMHQHECNTKEIKPMINFNYLRNKIRLNAN